MAEIINKDVIIVGAGAAGAAAALSLEGAEVLMLDVGMSATKSSLPNSPLASLYGTQSESVETLDNALIGRSFSSFIQEDEAGLCLKLKGPEARFAITRPPQLPGDLHENFLSIQSFTKGGLANFWGAGAMRYTEEELKHFPIEQSELDPFFDMLTDHIGISGSKTDDLAGYFGSTRGLLPELNLCDLGQRFEKCYLRWRSFFNNRGITIGRPRLAVLPVHHRGRRPHVAFGQEFFNAPHEGIYSPSFTIDELIKKGKLEYLSGILVDYFSQKDGVVTLFCREVSSGKRLTFIARRVVLAAGTINSSRVVLKSRNDYVTKLPLLDNPVSFLPCIDLLRIGVPLKQQGFPGAELNLIFRSKPDTLPIQGSLYNLMGPLRTDILKEFPLTFRGNLDACRFLAPAIFMLQLFYPDRHHEDNYIQLREDGQMRIVRKGPHPEAVEDKLASTLRWLGYGVLASLAKRPIAGSSIHYAGTLPSRRSPQNAYDTDTLGRLDWADRVHVADAANFPILPAKNHTLMLMANAARIGAHIAQSLLP